MAASPRQHAFRAAGLVLALCVCLGLAGPAGAGRAEPFSRYANSLGMEFVLLPAGSFLMGSPPDEPGRQGNEDQHRVTLSRPFYMQTTEVTCAQWWEVMGKRMLAPRQAKPDQPITKISWFDAREFARKLSRRGEGTYRLPTEAQWEYACRAGTDTAYAFGPALSCAQAMYANNTGTFEEDACVDYYRRQGLPVDQPAPVRSFAPNPWGLYDLHGNVWEWCRDWFAYYPEGPVTDPDGPDKGRYKARRGGSFWGGVHLLRSANRNYANPRFRERSLGFRVIRVAE